MAKVRNNKEISPRCKRLRKFKEFKKRKKETYTLIKRLYRFLRNNSDQISFKKLGGGILGYYDYGTAEITIDHRREVIPTLIHEFIHHIHPKWSETKVVNYERRIMNSLTSRQFKNIIRILSENI